MQSPSTPLSKLLWTRDKKTENGLSPLTDEYYIVNFDNGDRETQGANDVAYGRFEHNHQNIQ